MVGTIKNDGDKNLNSCTSHCSEWPSSESLQIANAGEHVAKREPSYIVGQNVSWYNHDREQCGSSLKN